MTRIEFPPDASISDRRAVVLASGLDIFSIQYLGREDLLKLQASLGYGSEWGTWTIPLDWLPMSRRRDHGRLVRLVCAAEIYDEAWLHILRLALIATLVPGRRGTIITPHSNQAFLYDATRLISHIVARRAHGSLSWWSCLTEVDVAQILRPASRASWFCERLHLFHALGYLPESPVPSARDNGAGERNRHGETEPTLSKHDRRHFQPLPDDFLGQCGQRVLWIITTLGPSLLDCLEQTIALGPHPTPHSSPELRASLLERRKTNRLDFVRAWVWRTPDGSLLEELPFSLKQIGRNPKDALTLRTPPKTFSGLMTFASMLQACHAWLLFLASGPRASTLASYEEDCLESVEGGFRIKGTQYKIPGTRSGVQKDWPAPTVVVFAAKQQIRLARIVKRSSQQSGSHLWVSFMRKGGQLEGIPRADFNMAFNKLVATLQLEHLLGEDNPTLHPHRFRKTLARLVALAMTNAQMILMDCFGHDDPEMTLGYMTSDKAIVGDALRMQRELVVLMARDAFLAADTLGGSAGERIREAKARFLRLHSKNALDPKDAFELAEVHTLGGRDWAVVMPGVICTLPTGFTGPCSLRQGGRDPANCQSGCNHQLLLAMHKTECDDNVRYILNNLQRAVDLDSVTIPMWQAQLNNWLFRWRDVYDAWARHPLVLQYGNPESCRGEIPA